MQMRTMLSFVAALFLLIGCGSPSDPTLLGDRSGRYDFPAWSMDGKRLAFTLQEDLWISSANGAGATRITGGLLGTGSRVKAAAWAPDGRIAYVESREGAKPNLIRNALVLCDPATGAKTVVHEDLGPVYDLSWHPSAPDKALMVMNLSSDVRNPGGHAVYELDARTGALIQLEAISAHRELSSARWLADGEQIAYVVDNTLYVLDMAMGSTQQSPYDAKAIGQIAVTPDGSQIAYRRYAKRDNEWISGTYVVARDFSRPPALISGEEMVRMDWSPDRKQLIYTTVGSPGKNQLRLFTLGV
jgi:Tol biopolymer transport system component